MTADWEDPKISLTKVPLAFAKQCVLLKAARWNNEEILQAGTEITDELIADYRDIAMYLPVSLRGQPTPSATVVMVRQNIDAYRLQQKSEKVRDISQSCEAGEVVFEQGDTENQDCFFLTEGAVDVEVDAQTVATIREPGQPIGEMSFLTEEPRSATIRAVEPSKLLCVPKKEKKHLLRSNPTIVKTLMDALVKRLKQTSQRLAEVQAVAARAEADAERLQAELERVRENGRTLARHTEKELGVRRGDFDLFERLLARVEEACGTQPDQGGMDTALGLLHDYRSYLAARGFSKVAEPVFSPEQMPPALRALLEEA